MSTLSRSAAAATSSTVKIPLPTSIQFDRLAEKTSTRVLAALIKSDVRNRLKWRKQQHDRSAAR